MDSDHRIAAIEGLARLACTLAGRNPDQHLRLQLGSVIVFDDLLWRYPDFVKRAEAAYGVLENGTLPA